MTPVVNGKDAAPDRPDAGRPVAASSGAGFPDVAGPGDSREPALIRRSRLGRWRGVVGASLWLVFLASPVSTALERHPSWEGQLLVAAVTVAFCATYVPIFLLVRRGADQPRAMVLLVTLAALCVAFCLLAGEDGMFCLVYLAAGGAAELPARTSAWWTAGCVAATIAAPLAVPGWHLTPEGTMSVLLGALASSAFVSLLRRNWQLREAQGTIARLAVADERLRFSRDLHDILGHSLTVITVKAELAGRLIEQRPERAADEIADVERLAREALADVRATVAGYRATSLAAELSQARHALESAGIEAVLPNSADEVTGPPREVFGWVVREGVTNVVRHSGAATCTVRLTPTSVEVVDDGSGSRSGKGRDGRIRNGHEQAGQASVERPFNLSDGFDETSSSHGLVGLAERVRAAGGSLTAGPLPEGGFALRAEVPA
ncbi:two-component system, NarL family, sensor histidine kinase DesK [Actinopolymorpha cephalotaxi]|uniref:Two-component system, NarL family, sensor histidine kinase DesK n=1 Tax=Actinopolymorpha cephalotaxi TaxID=504797 RepID=A0A1I2R0Y9_9ACTN|nr:two-component system, NarL family, sensor histidine kinase DesK [Actinopolymorpha cephalotaxi]